MDNMNFLHKKYTSTYNQSLSNSRSSKSFLPPQNTNIPRQVSARQQPVNQTQNINTNPQQHLLNNHCSIHTQQLLRFMCTECIQLLCSECIGEHILMHKQNNTYPSISSLKQLKQQMNIKLGDMTNFMMSENNNPKCINVDLIRKQSNLKIDEVRKQLLMMVQEWIIRLRNSVINNLGYDELALIKKEMYCLQQQVQSLNNSLINANTSVQSIKKAYQIDGQKLYKSYKLMIDKYYSVKSSLQLQIKINQTKFFQALQSSVQLKAGQSNIIKVQNLEENEDQIQENDDQILEKDVLIKDGQQLQDNSKIDLPLQVSNSLYQVKEQKQQVQCLGLYQLQPGSSILSHQNITNNQIFSKIVQYNIDIKTYPLNSVSLLPDSMIVISGGMISVSQKNNTIQIYDYTQGLIITQQHLKYSRSSHSTIKYKDKIFFIGGFVNQGQCQNIQVLTGDGIYESPNICKYGGSNLCVLTKQGILKITLSGVQIMNLQTLQWKQLKSDVPFSISKGMSIQYLGENNSAYIFGFQDENIFYQWNCQENKFISHNSKIIIGSIKSSIVKNQFIYAWNQEQDILCFDKKEWKIIKNDKT